MNKNTKLYLGIGVTALVIYLIYKNRQQFGGAVDVQTPLGGLSASAGGGDVRVGVNAPVSMMGNILPDGTMVQQAI